MRNKLTTEQINLAKSKGFLHNRGTRNFSGRIITDNGILTADQMALLSEAAKEFGNGRITFTVRLNAEVQGIEYENIDAFMEFISRENMETGGTGNKVRQVVACKGSTCTNGICDTYSMANKMHKAFYEEYENVELPHKFKIGIGGCANNCTKPDLNDIGIVAQNIVSTDENVKTTEMFKVYIGGKWGKNTRMGTPINKLFTQEEVYEVVESAILLYKSRGIQGERFGDTIDRIGIDTAINILIKREILDEKEEILTLERKSKYNC